MRIVRIRIANFRCIKHAEFFPVVHNVLLAPNNSGKTAVLEALNLLLSPESANRSQPIDENDFFQREYVVLVPAGAATPPAPAADPAVASPPTDRGSAELAAASAGGHPAPARPCPKMVPSDDPTTWPRIRIEAVLTDLNSEDEDLFRNQLVPWNPTTAQVVENSEEGEDPFGDAQTAIRVVGEGWYDVGEDDFRFETYFQKADTDNFDTSDRFGREHKRHIGFLIYRDLRALTRPTTLDPTTLFSRLLQSQGVIPKHFESVLDRLEGSLAPMVFEADFLAILNAYQAEIERYLWLTDDDPSRLSFELTERTRSEVKHQSQLYVRDGIPLPIQKQGAGTRSLATLAILSLIMRRRGRGILALEEPETFLFPHAQRRVIDECLTLATQTFVTTHSPYVLERVPIEGVARIARGPTGTVTWRNLAPAGAKDVNLYSRYLRKSFCEALLGRGVVLVEGESDRWWLNAAGRILHGKTVRGRRQEALELQGFATVSADTNGDIAKFGKFFDRAGLLVLGIVDRLPLTDPIVTDLCTSTFPVMFLSVDGIEDVLAAHLPIDIVRRVLGEAPYSKTPLPDPEAVAGMSELDARKEVRKLLMANKGSASMHEWIASLLDETTLPSALVAIVDLIGRAAAGDEVQTQTILR